MKWIWFACVLQFLWLQMAWYVASINFLYIIDHQKSANAIFFHPKQTVWRFHGSSTSSYTVVMPVSYCDKWYVQSLYEVCTRAWGSSLSSDWRGFIRPRCPYLTSAFWRGGGLEYDVNCVLICNDTCKQERKDCTIPKAHQ